MNTLAWVIEFGVGGSSNSKLENLKLLHSFTPNLELLVEQFVSFSLYLDP